MAARALSLGRARRRARLYIAPGDCQESAPGAPAPRFDRRPRRLLACAPPSPRAPPPGGGRSAQQRHRVAPPSPLKSIPPSWTVLATGFTVLFFGGGALFSFGLLLVPMTEDLGWSRSSLSLALTTFMVVSALAMPLVGRIVDRGDIRVVLAASVTLVAIGTGLMWGITAHWQVFVLYGIVFALGNAGSSIPTVSVMVSRWWSAGRGLANSAAIAGMSLGQLAIITVLASLLTSIGWRVSYAVLGAANLFIVVPLVLAFARSRPPTPPERRAAGEAGPRTAPERPVVRAEGLSDLARSRYMWLLVGMFAICGFQDFFVSTHVVAFALDHDVGDLLAGNMLALMGLTALGGVMASGYLSDRYGPAVPSVICFLVRTAIFAFILASQTTPSIVAFALLYGSTFLITAPLVVIFAGQIFGQRHLGTVTGILSMVHQICGGVGAYVGASLFDHTGSYDRAFLVALGMALAAIVLSALLHRPRTPDGGEAAPSPAGSLASAG